MTIPLEIADSTSGSWTVVTVTGEVDVATSPELFDALDRATDDKQRLVVDLSRVTFMDSTGLGVLIQTLRAVLAKDGEMRLVVHEQNVRKIFEVTGLDGVIQIYGSLADATA
ncbi:MAG TPA: STAS domain-containing protein [Acidimicrobiales bacterium]|nr:STAS domain-containing protein [Acidimicrobiales bacterium]